MRWSKLGGTELSAKDYIDHSKTFGMNKPFGANPKLSPCKECKERHEGCHSSCLKYVAFSLHQDDQCEERVETERRKQSNYEHRLKAVKTSKRNGQRTGYAKTRSGKRMVREYAK